MDNKYEIADIPESCVSEINALQERLKQDTNRDIVLIAYQSSKADEQYRLLAASFNNPRIIIGIVIQQKKYLKNRKSSVLSY